MKKAIVKGTVFGLVFFLAVIIISHIMNKGNDDLTVEMAPAGFPVVYMGLDGIVYNELHGYAQTMDTAYMRDTITALNEGRTAEFTIDTYGQYLNKLSYEVRSVDGERLIEDTEIKEYDEKNGIITGKLTVKDLIEKNTEYELILLLDTGEAVIRYYTRIVWSEEYHTAEKLEFARMFHEKSFDREEARDLAKYMETNSAGDNSTLHEVDIHCSLNQVTWGNLAVEKVTEPVFNVRELASQTASITGGYFVSTGSGREKTYFYVEEYYRLRYTADRIYLLDYYRTMDSIVNEQDDIYVNDKIMLGVADENLPLVESEDGNVFAFVQQNRLYSYNVTTNKMTVIFSFYDGKNADARTMYNQHGIKILSIDEGGNVQFAVYGYMNRGRHEGKVGFQVYYYDSALNTIEEVLYIPYDKTYQILKAEADRLLYLSWENYLYLMFGNTLYEINTVQKSSSSIVETAQDDSLKVSESNRMAVWQSKGSLYEATELVLMDLGTREKTFIASGAGEYILPLGFMGEDLVYGLARREDIVTDTAGRITFPMYAVYICDARGEILKSYRQQNIYVSGCSMQSNQITLERLVKLEDGAYEEASPDNIMNNTEMETGKNTIKPVFTENYGEFVQIAVKKDIDAKTLQIRTPKEVLYEGGRELSLTGGESADRYYVYGLEGVSGICKNPARAVSMAEEGFGVVINDDGEYVWMRGNRVTRNQIMAIEAAAVTEEKNSMAVCLETVLKYEGVIRNAQHLLDTGETAYEIWKNNLEEAQVLDLEGCSLDAVLYYVNRDLPVLATLNDGSAVLIVGFNQYNIVLMDPKSGSLEKAGMNDSAEWFAENGNNFLSYIK